MTSHRLELSLYEFSGGDLINADSLEISIFFVNTGEQMTVDYIDIVNEDIGKYSFTWELPPTARSGRYKAVWLANLHNSQVTAEEFFWITAPTATDAERVELYVAQERRRIQAKATIEASLRGNPEAYKALIAKWQPVIDFKESRLND